jgi:hypothetical protein
MNIYQHVLPDMQEDAAERLWEILPCLVRGDEPSQLGLVLGGKVISSAYRKLGHFHY